MKVMADGIIVHTFQTSDEAWAFMRACDERGEVAGYPALQEHGAYTVKVVVGPIKHGAVL